MGSGSGDRAVSEVVGFVLVFGTLVVAFTVYQGVVVPDQNRAVEFRHNQAVQGQLQDLRNAIVSASATGTNRATSITLGARYPRRAVARNLGRSAGAIETAPVGNGTIRVENATAASDAETADYLDGSTLRYETRSIVYTPVYSFYSNHPETIYENTFLYNRFGSTSVPITDQSLIDGRRIRLVATDGSLSRAERDTVTVDVEPVSASSTRVDVVGEGGQNVKITVPTSLPATEWEEILADELVGNGGHVVGVNRSGQDEVSILLESDQVYELRTARIGVGDLTDTPSERYVTIRSGNGTTVVPDGTVPLVVEVRDRYNNPVSGVTVNASPGDEDVVAEPTLRTNAAGRATFHYSAPDTATTGRERVSFHIGESPADHEVVTFTVNVLDVNGGGGRGGTAADAQ